MRILVVDDQADARELLKAVLERCGAAVTTAASARRRRWPRCGADRPDVLIADIEMPEESGYDLLRQLRALPAELGGKTPAVALTAYATAHDRVQALRAGFQMHVTKPVQPAELAAVVASLAPKRAVERRPASGAAFDRDEVRVQRAQVGREDPLRLPRAAEAVGAEQRDRVLLDHVVPELFETGGGGQVVRPEEVDHLAVDAHVAEAAGPGGRRSARG